MSADVRDAGLRDCLSWRLRLCRKLKHRCLLTLMEISQENYFTGRKFQRIVMRYCVVFVDLPKDGSFGVYCPDLPAEDAERCRSHLLRKSKFRPGKNADRHGGILRRRKP